MTMTQKELNTMKKDLSEIKEILSKEVEEKASATTHKIRNLFPQKDLQHMANRAGKEMRHFMNEKLDQAKQVKHVSEYKIKKNPFKSFALAFASGVLLGSFFKINK